MQSFWEDFWRFFCYDKKIEKKSLKFWYLFLELFYTKYVNNLGYPHNVRIKFDIFFLELKSAACHLVIGLDWH